MQIITFPEEILDFRKANISILPDENQLDL